MTITHLFKFIGYVDNPFFVWSLFKPWSFFLLGYLAFFFLLTPSFIVVPLYLQGSHSQAPSGCLKLWIETNPPVSFYTFTPVINFNLYIRHSKKLTITTYNEVNKTMYCSSPGRRGSVGWSTIPNEEVAGRGLWLGALSGPGPGGRLGPQSGCVQAAARGCFSHQRFSLSLPSLLNEN